MKNLKILLCFGILSFCIPTESNACNQSHTECVDDLGLYLICKAPYKATCYSGGCGAPVTSVICAGEDPEE